MGSSEAAFCGVLQGRRGDASRWARLRRLSAGFCRATETMLPVGLVRGGFLRGFPMPPRRCFPRGSSEAGFHGLLQRRRCAQRRRSLLSFFPPPPGRTSFFTIRPDNDAARAHSRSRKPAGSPYPFPHFPRAPESCFFLYPAARPTIPRTVAETMLADGLVRGGFLRAFPRSLRGSSEAGFPRGFFQWVLPEGLVRGGFLRAFPMPPRRCSPKGSSEAAFCGVFQCRRGGASRGARPRRLPTGFCRAAEAMLAEGLVRGGHARLIPPVPARGCSCSRLLPPHLSFDFRPALPSAQPTPVRASLPRRFLRFRAALFPAAARCIRPCSCAGGRVAPFFRLSPRTPRAFLALRPPRARPVRPPRTPGTSVPPRTPGASVPLLAAVRFGSHSAVQSLPIFFHRPAGKRTRKANLIRTYVRIRF